MSNTFTTDGIGCIEAPSLATFAGFNGLGRGPPEEHRQTCVGLCVRPYSREPVGNCERSNREAQNAVPRQLAHSWLCLRECRTGERFDLRCSHSAERIAGKWCRGR